MKIENEVKLAFDDVMIIPKRSTLKSRSDVSLQRSFKFRHSTLRWEGIPIMAANMDTVGTKEMANVLGKYDILTALHKFYNERDMCEMNFANSIITIGEGKIPDYLSSPALYDRFKFLMVDVANGYR